MNAALPIFKHSCTQQADWVGNRWKRREQRETTNFGDHEGSTQHKQEGFQARGRAHNQRIWLAWLHSTKRIAEALLSAFSDAACTGWRWGTFGKVRHGTVQRPTCSETVVHSSVPLPLLTARPTGGTAASTAPARTSRPRHAQRAALWGPAGCTAGNPALLRPAALPAPASRSSGPTYGARAAALPHSLLCPLLCLPLLLRLMRLLRRLMRLLLRPLLRPACWLLPAPRPQEGASTQRPGMWAAAVRRRSVQR